MCLFAILQSWGFSFRGSLVLHRTEKQRQLRRSGRLEAKLGVLFLFFSGSRIPHLGHRFGVPIIKMHHLRLKGLIIGSPLQEFPYSSSREDSEGNNFGRFCGCWSAGIGDGKERRRSYAWKFESFGLEGSTNR